MERRVAGGHVVVEGVGQRGRPVGETPQSGLDCVDRSENPVLLLGAKDHVLRSPADLFIQIGGLPQKIDLPSQIPLPVPRLHSGRGTRRIQPADVPIDEELHLATAQHHHIIDPVAVHVDDLHLQRRTGSIQAVIPNRESLPCFILQKGDKRSFGTDRYQVAEYVGRQVRQRQIDQRHAQVHLLDQVEIESTSFVQLILQDDYVPGSPVGHQHVVIPVRVEVYQFHSNRFKTDHEIPVSFKIAAAVLAEQHRDSSRLAVGHHDIHLPVGVQVGGGQGHRSLLHRMRHACVEAPFPVVEQQRYRGDIAVGHPDIDVAVGVQIDRQHIGDAVADEDIPAVMVKGTVSGIFEDGDRVGDLVGDDQIGKLGKNRRGGQGDRRIPFLVQRAGSRVNGRVEEGPATVVQQHPHLAGGAVGNRQVGRPVLIPVGDQQIDSSLAYLHRRLRAERQPTAYSRQFDLQSALRSGSVADDPQKVFVTAAHQGQKGKFGRLCLPGSNQ